MKALRACQGSGGFFCILKFRIFAVSIHIINRGLFKLITILYSPYSFTNTLVTIHVISRFKFN